MTAITPNDICYSTARDGDNPFNTDGQRRTELPADLARSAFDFNILKKPNFDERGRQIPWQFHLEKNTDGSLIPSTSVGAKFTPIQHLDVFDYIVNEVMPEVPGLKLEMAGTIHGGGTSLIAAKFGDTFSLPGDTSPNEMRLFFRNPCNGTGRMTLGFTTVRVVCQNTLLAATQEAAQDGWTIKHTKSGPEMTSAAVHAIHGQARAALEIKERCRLLAETGIDGATFRRCLDAVYPVDSLPEGHARSRLENLRDEVVRQFESGETARTMKTKSAWAAFNSFTYPIFNPPRLRKGEDLAQVQYKAQMGDKARRVSDIFRKVERIAVYAA